jgi:hypothetical protein
MESAYREATAGEIAPGGLIGGEAYQRAFHIVKQTRPGASHRPAPSNEYIVASRPPMKGQQQPRGFAQPPLGPIAHDRPADLAGRGEAGANQRPVVAALQRLDHDRAARTGRRLGAGQKLRPLAQALYDEGFG